MKKLSLLALVLTSQLIAGQLTLNWNDNSDNEDGFLIERSTDGTAFLEIGGAAQDATTFEDTGLLPETEYWYRVRAFNFTGNSGYSNVANAITDALGSLPASPGGLNVTLPGTLTNLSTRGLVMVDAEIMIGGIVISGGPVNVLIRGVGPTLGNFGVPNTLSDPEITLLDDAGTFIRSNDNWQGQIISDAAAAVGAFPLEVGSLDAAMLITLDPGAYTIHLTGVNGATGVAILEFFQVP